MYIIPDCTWTPYGTDPIFDELVDDTDKHIRRDMVLKSYGLDKLINDPNPYVRMAVATQGYGLDILINDPNIWVRAEVAKHHYMLDTLINDTEWPVRQAVAKQGYGLDKLINDNYKQVVAAVKHYLNEHNLTIDKYKKLCSDKCVLDKNIDFICIKTFITKLVETNLRIKTSYESIDKYFSTDFANNITLDTLSIYTEDNVPMLKFEKTSKLYYKLIVDYDEISMNTIIRSNDQLVQKINRLIDEDFMFYPEFAKYIDTLKSCL